MGLSNQIGTVQPGMIADMDIINGNPLEHIETIANDVYVMQNGNIYTEKQLIAPYANVHDNTPPASTSAAAFAQAEEATLSGSSSGKVSWTTPFELKNLEKAVILLCHMD